MRILAAPLRALFGCLDFLTSMIKWWSVPYLLYLPLFARVCGEVR